MSDIKYLTSNEFFTAMLTHTNSVLIQPRREVANYSDLEYGEMNDLNMIIRNSSNILKDFYKKSEIYVGGFNIIMPYDRAGFYVYIEAVISNDIVEMVSNADTKDEKEEIIKKIMGDAKIVSNSQDYH